MEFLNTEAWSQEEQESMGGFKYAYCPAGYTAADGNDKYWAEYQPSNSYKCRKNHILNNK